MNLATRQKIERQVVRFLIKTMNKHDWNVVSVYDGEEYYSVSTIKEAMDCIFAVDEAVIVFYNKEYDRKHTAFIVLGNDGYDAICDYSYNIDDSFQDVMQRFVDPYTDDIANRY